MNNKEFDLSSFTEGKELETEEEIIELAVSLARINRLHELGEIPNKNIAPLTDNQLALIKKILRSYQKEPNPSEFSSYNRLVKRLQELDEEIDQLDNPS